MSDRDVMRRFLQFGGIWLKKTIQSPHTRTLFVGTSAGAFLLAWTSQWTARLGNSLAVLSALGLAILVGIELGFRPFKSRRPAKSVLWAIVGSLLFLAACTASFPWLIEWQTQLLGAFSPLELAKPWLALSLCLGIGLVLITPAVVVVARLPYCLLASEGIATPARILLPVFLLGTAGGMLISAFVLSPLFGLLPSTLLIVSATGISMALGFARKTTNDSPSVDEATQTADVAASPADPTLWHQGREIWAALVLVVLGGLFAWSSRVIHQLMPVSVALVAARWSFLILGFAIGFRPRRRGSANPSHQAGELSSVFLAAYGVAFAASFPFCVDLCLSLTVALSNVVLLTLCRLGLVFVMLAPLGIVWGRIAVLLFKPEPGGDMDPNTSFPAASVPTLGWAVVSGWLFTKWVLLPSASMVSIALGLSLVASALAVLRLVLVFKLPKRLVPRIALAGFTLMFSMSFFSVKNYRPETSAELLFAAPVFIAHQAGVDEALLTELDEGRHIATREGQQATYTLWKYRGVQHQLRQNGLPKGMASGDVMMCPEYSAEALPSLMPLVLHERPDRVLVLGMGSGVSVTTALAFPIQEVTCAETDPALIELVKEQMWNAQPSDPTEDPRLSILPIDPALLLRAKSDPFDVIVSLPHQTMVAETAACFTEAFYRDAARKLAEDGLFCQRFTFVDLGPDALRVAARTMQAVFQDVVFLEMAGGEMLLLGTNSQKGVARDGFLARLQKRHVKRQLAALGWDWSVPLNLSAFNHQALEKFASESTAWGPKLNTLASGAFAFGLPGDMMRWGPKPQENQMALAPHLGRFAKWGGIDPEDPDLLRRLAEVTGQRNLMAHHPDEYWAYRKTVKDQVTQRPRSVIVQVKDEFPRQEIHEEDQRRLDYFRALGKAYKHKPHRPEDIAKVETFAEPYDPLITFFLHQEVAELHSHALERNYAAELAHRVHSVFFAAPQDRSIRNVIAAIELLCEHPESAGAPLERWDHLNAMLQMVKQRWVLRAGVNPTSTQVTLNDVDKSLEAVHKALGALDELRAEVGIDAGGWQARRQFVESTIISPLRVYRRQLMPYHQRERVIQEKKQSAEEE